MNVDSIAHGYQVGLKSIFIKQKCYRIYMWHLNKVWSTHFAEDIATFVLTRYNAS